MKKNIKIIASLVTTIIIVSWVLVLLNMVGTLIVVGIGTTLLASVVTTICGDLRKFESKQTYKV